MFETLNNLTHKLTKDTTYHEACQENSSELHRCLVYRLDYAVDKDMT